MKNKISLGLFACSLLMGFILPLVYQDFFICETLYGIKVSPKIYEVISLSAGSFLIGYFINNYYFSSLNNAFYVSNNLLAEFLKKLEKYFNFISYIILIILFLSILYGFPNYLKQELFRFAIFENYSSLIHKIALFGAVYAIAIEKNKYLSIAIIGESILVLFMSQSRGLALVFLLISYGYFLRRRYKYSALTFISAVLSYMYVIVFRNVTFSQYKTEVVGYFQLVANTTSISSFLNNVIINKINIDFVSTISIVIKFSETIIYKLNDYFYYLLYISPIPGFLLDERVGKFTSISFISGVNLGTGINTDYFSEPYLVFGIYGVIIIWLILGFIFGMMDKVNILLIQNKEYSLAFINTCAIFIFFAIGSVAPIRAATRLLMFLICLNAVIYFINKIYEKNFLAK